MIEPLVPQVPTWQTTEAIRNEQVEKINELVEQSNNTERAVQQLCYWLVQAQTGFNLHDAQGIIKVLHGETNPEAKP